MADKSIEQLIAAEQILPTDLFVLQQSNMAKKLTGQVLLNWLTAAADGHGGISSIERISTNVLVDTYRITMADTTTFDFVVTNGRSVNTIVKVGTADLVDTYQINYNDGTTGTFNVTNGAKGDKGDNAYIWIKYASQKPTASSHSFGDVVDDWIGIYYGTSATAPTDWQQYEWFQIKGEKGDPGVPAILVSSVTGYQTSDSGTVIPSGAWLSSVPVVAQGKYLWTRTTNTFNTGAPAVSYSVSRMGIDGTGSVSSVANISPDADGNIPLTASDVGALPTNGGDLTGELRMNGQPISGLNVPNANDQAANMGFVNQQVKKAAPRNLLDNSDFTNPVMLGGFNTVRGNYRYPIDRWYDRYGYGVFTKTDSGITVACGTNHGYFNQNVVNYERLSGKHLTLAVCDYDGNIYCGSSLWNTSDSYIRMQLTENCEAEFTSGGFVQIVVIAGSFGLRWAALYEGEFTAETLPEHQPKGYENELLVCRQYDPVTGEYIGLRKFGYAHNLLDNSDFTNPVNQGGLTSYAGDYGYCIDRWTRTANGTVTLVTNGVQLAASSAGNAMISQDIAATPDMVGKSFTLAYCTGGGVVGCVTFPVTTIDVSSNVALSGNIVTDGNSIGYVYLVPNRILKIQLLAYKSKTAIFRWVALYEGVYSIDTLPEYVPKERVVEERNCGIVPFAPDLLWQNASVVSQFDPQTIALDLSTYAWLILEWAFSTENDNRYTMLIPTRDTSKHEMHINATSQNRDGGRLVSVDGNNVVFEAGKYNSSTSNKNVIPTRIWGLKEAMV